MEAYIKIAICDDEMEILNNITTRIENFIKNKMYEGEVHEFSDGYSLLNKVENNNENYDIYILDVDMGKINGVDVAKKIRKIQKDVIIVFFTGYETWMPEAFDVQAFNYILKSSKADKLEEVLEKALGCIKERRTLF